MSLVFADPSFSQERSGSHLNVSGDFYSSYIWRGTQYGTGMAIQPSLKYSNLWLVAGAWGSFDLNGYKETDLYFTVLLPAGFNAGLTAYYYPGLRYNDWSSETGSHAYELNLGFAVGGLSLSGNYVINQAGGAGSLGGDMYFQASWQFAFVSLFAGAGNGWHTYDSETGESDFNFCNLGLTATKSIKVTDTFAIPVTGQLVYNPDRQQMFLVVGFSIGV